MWLPRTSRTRAAPSPPKPSRISWPTQGPPALTTALARTSSATPSARTVQPPALAVAVGGLEAGAGADHRAARRGVAGVQHHEPGVVDPAVGVFEGLDEARLQRLARRVAAEVEGAGAGQDPPAAEVVVDRQAEAEQPGGPEAGVVRQHEAQRPGDVRRARKQHLALDQRLADQPELVVFEVAQAAVDELGRARRGGAGEIALLEEHDLQAAAGGVARDAAAVDAAADDREVVDGGGGHCGTSATAISTPARAQASAKARRRRRVGDEGVDLGDVADADRRGALELQRVADQDGAPGVGDDGAGRPPPRACRSPSSRRPRRAPRRRSPRSRP